MKYYSQNVSFFYKVLFIYPLLALVLFQFFTEKSFAQQISTIKAEKIAPGVTFTEFRSIADSTNVYELKVDLKKGNYIFTALKAGNKLKARETTSSMAARASKEGYDVLAAVNADFFNMKNGENENNMIINGQFEKGVNITDSPFDKFNNPHSQFGFTFNRKPLIGRFRFEGRLFLNDGRSIRINRVNSMPDSNSVSLYNHFQTELPKIPSSWKQTVVVLKYNSENGDTLYFSTGNYNKKNDSALIGKNKYLLCGYNDFADSLKESIAGLKSLKVLLSLTPYEGRIFTLVGGWPGLIVNGKSIAGSADSIEGTFPRFSETKHPRTGIGFSKDSTTIFLFAVDGRSESNSGMSLMQFADFMLARGVYQGMNFDGGGSTTMFVKGKVVNHPSDKIGERAVGSCLLLIKK